MSMTVKTAVVHGIAWLFDMEQPEGAVISPHGLAVSVPDERRTVRFLPRGSHGYPVIVLTHEDPNLPLRLNEVESLGQWCQRLRVTVRQTWNGHPSSTGSVELFRSARPSLRQAVERYEEGCPQHAPALECECSWYTVGRACLRLPQVLAREGVTA
jgi:hypothetical protein